MLNPLLARFACDGHQPQHPKARHTSSGKLAKQSHVGPSIEAKKLFTFEAISR
jgi:hypothetical protein